MYLDSVRKSNGTKKGAVRPVRSLLHECITQHCFARLGNGSIAQPEVTQPECSRHRVIETYFGGDKNRDRDLPHRSGMQSGNMLMLLVLPEPHATTAAENIIDRSLGNLYTWRADLRS